jgi:periplasmic copper chaperone A
VERNLILILAMAMLLSACSAEKGIEVHEVWMRPTAQGNNGAVYFVLHNHSSEADEMTGASSDVAEAVEMHESKMNGDIMEMNQVKTIPLEAYAEIDFAPGKYHIMLVNLKKTLKVGDEIEMTLHFKNFEDISVTVPVRDSPTPEEDHSSTDHS